MHPIHNGHLYPSNSDKIISVKVLNSDMSFYHLGWCKSASHISRETTIENNQTLHTRCPNKHGNSVTNSISSLLCISIVIPDFKSHNIIISAWVYFMKTVNGCKDVFIMSPQDEQWRRTSLLCLYTVIFLFY